MKEQLITFVKHFEGCVLHVYNDVAGYPTIGVGHKLLPGENYTEITEQQANDLLWMDLQHAMQAVKKLIHRPLNDSQFIALTDFCYNLGSGALQRSQVRMCINRGDLIAGAGKMVQYSHAAGKLVKGLLVRREAEKQLFLTGE